MEVSPCRRTLVSVGVTNAVPHPRSQCGEQAGDLVVFLTASDPDTAITGTLAFVEKWS